MDAVGKESLMEELMQEFDQMFPKKGLLEVGDICKVLECDVTTVYNWSKRTNPKKRPPHLLVGNDSKYPRMAFIRWLVTDRLRGGI